MEPDMEFLGYSGWKTARTLDKHGSCQHTSSMGFRSPKRKPKPTTLKWVEKERMTMTMTMTMIIIIIIKNCKIRLSITQLCGIVCAALTSEEPLRHGAAHRVTKAASDGRAATPWKNDTGISSTMTMMIMMMIRGHSGASCSAMRSPLQTSSV